MHEFALQSIPGPSDLSVARTAIVTTCVVLVIWLGLLARPSRAMLYFTLAFLLALLGTYGSMVSAAFGMDVIGHPVGIGIAFGAPMLIWSGIREANGRRAYPWIGFAQSAVSIGLLAFTTYLPFGFDLFRWLYFFAALGAALGGIEVMRGVYRGSRFSSPLVTISFAGVGFALIGVAPTIVPGIAEAQSDILFLRSAALATSIYIICATVSLLFLVNRRPGARDVLEALDAFAPPALFSAMTRERLHRAALRRETSWTIVDLRIDDAADIRAAVGEVAFGGICRRFESIIASTLPAEADLGRVVAGHVLVLIAQPARSVQELVRPILAAFSADDAASPISVRISASAGIAPVQPRSDTVESLVEAAAGAAEAAQAAGGDQWMLAAPDTTPVAAPTR